MSLTKYQASVPEISISVALEHMESDPYAGAFLLEPLDVQSCKLKSDLYEKYGQQVNVTMRVAERLQPPHAEVRVAPHAEGVPPVAVAIGAMLSCRYATSVTVTDGDDVRVTSTGKVSAKTVNDPARLSRLVGNFQEEYLGARVRTVDHRPN